MEERNCSRCKRLLPTTQFAKSKRSSHGYCSQCKDCVKEYQLANKEKLKAYQRSYQPQYKAEHKEELNAYIRNWQKTVGKERHHAYIKQWRAEHPERVKEYIRISNERAKSKQANGQ